jgi:Na+/H+-translocating membrane pyrophosphatase
VVIQVNENRNDPNECILISTRSSLKNMILPGILVIFTPLLIGFLFGKEAIGGYLIGVIVSGVQMAISSSNTGGAWDNAKKYIEAGKLEVTEDDIKKDPNLSGLTHFKKKSLPHQAAVVGDTVGDPLKDTSGPSLNILIKLSAIVSLVFGSILDEYHLIK